MFYSCIKNMVIYLLIVGIANNLVPGKEYKKYISFFNGIIVLLIVLEPIVILAEKPIASYEFYYDLFVNEIGDEQALKDFFEVDDSAGKTVNYLTKAYEDSIGYILNRQMKDAKADGYLIKDVSAQIDAEGNITSCVVTYNGEIAKEEKNKLKKIISEVYNLNLDNIYISKR